MDRLKENFSKKCLTRLSKLLKIGEHQQKHLTGSSEIFMLDELKYNISHGLFFNQFISAQAYFSEVSNVQIPRDMDRIDAYGQNHVKIFIYPPLWVIKK